jgi:glycosyltransferase involved in cell wall biosynthesis
MHGNFDPMLSYSRKLQSGYGWEDVDIGARIYAGKGTIRYTSQAFSIHISHESSMQPAEQVRGSAQNFHYLIKKHPFIRAVARRWYVDTADRIVSWADEIGETSPALEFLRNDIREPKRAIAPLIPYLRKQKRRYRILTHRWHVPHQREIYKLPFDFTLLTGTGTGFTNDWGYDQRPLRPNVRLVPAESVDPSAFDLAIVHFDENVLCPDLSNGVLGAEWGDTFRWFIENIKLPMVAVCHGTVPFVGQYAANADAIRQFELYQSEADNLRNALADVNVVVNSYQAADEWYFRRSRVIWHGLDPQEFNEGTHELDIIHHGIDQHRPHYRGAHALRQALKILEAEGLKISSHKHESTAPVPRSDPRFSDFAFKDWVDHLGRHKVYLNTTLRSPMPRSRTEAMLCGVIPVSLDNHDVSRFIQNGVNGFCSSSIEELAEFCKTVCRDEQMRKKMSEAARATAMDLFNHDRFLTEWVNLVEETIKYGRIA